MKQTITGVVIGMVAGVVLTMGVVALTGSSEYEKSGQQVVSHKDMSMSDMTSQLKGLRGDAYDQAWVEMMIAHHEGAVEMAKLSADRAGHEEVKALSMAIIEAQNKEIADMKSWQSAWGLSGNEASQTMHTGH